MATKPCDAPCPKCGSDNTEVRWYAKHDKVFNEDYEKCRSRFAAGQGNHFTATKDHIDHVCQRCKYRWQTPVPRTKRQKRERAVAPGPDYGSPRGSSVSEPTTILLSQCPFCAGPPNVTVQNWPGGGAAERLDDYGENGKEVTSYVFCHECGAQGPDEDATIYDAAEYDAAERAACERWNRRDQRHVALFRESTARGLTQYPRPDDV
jgi:hypothetical protein